MSPASEQPTRRIYLVEDDKALIQEAQRHLPDNYYVVDVPLGEASKGEYWRTLALTPQDLPVIDLNLRQQYNGKAILQLLQREKRAGRLSGLERVLVATAIREDLQPGYDGIISSVKAYRIYGLAKDMKAVPTVQRNGRVINREDVDVRTYGYLLKVMVEKIYGGIAVPINF